MEVEERSGWALCSLVSICFFPFVMLGDIYCISSLSYACLCGLCVSYLSEVFLFRFKIVFLFECFYFVAVYISPFANYTLRRNY